MDGRFGLCLPFDNSLDAFIDDGDDYKMIEKIQLDNYLYLGIPG